MPQQRALEGRRTLLFWGAPAEAPEARLPRAELPKAEVWAGIKGRLKASSAQLCSHILAAATFSQSAPMKAARMFLALALVALALQPAARLAASAAPPLRPH